MLSPMPRSRLSIDQVLAWADSHHARTGKYPVAHSGPVHEAPDETWLNINQAMCAGMRGFTRRQTTLARLLKEHRGKRNPGELPDLSVEQIRGWADEHHQRTGKWPTQHSGTIPGTEETWARVQMAIFRGRRGLTKSSLAALLAGERAVKKQMPTVQQILSWADAHRERTGKWPRRLSGPITDSGGLEWCSVDRGLQATGDTLCKLLSRERGVVPWNRRSRLTITQILSWADEYHEASGRWPTRTSGRVASAPHESWWQINQALARGKRGLKGGSSLVRLFAKKRGRSLYETLPPLTIEQIREWARAYKAKHGRWPDRKSGDVDGVPGETWLAVWVAMQQGTRGLRRRVEVSEVFRE